MPFFFCWQSNLLASRQLVLSQFVQFVNETTVLGDVVIAVVDKIIRVNLFFCCYNCYDVGTDQYQCACYGFIPCQYILTQHDGYERSDDGLEIGVDRDRCGLEVFHRKGDEEIA